MISAHSRLVSSCDRCVWAMVLCELAELALHIRRLPSTTTTQPMQRQRLFCLTWIALISCTLLGAWEQCQWQRPPLLSLFRDRSCRGLSPTTVCDRLFLGKLRDENISGKREFLAGNRDQPYQASLDARLLIPLPVRRRASTVRSPIRARRASDTTRGQDEDSFGISRSCSVVIGICRTIAANGRALPTAFAVQKIWRENLGTNQDLLL